MVYVSASEMLLKGKICDELTEKTNSVYVYVIYNYSRS